MVSEVSRIQPNAVKTGDDRSSRTRQKKLKATNTDFFATFHVLEKKLQMDVNQT